jgi:hypothetical protein
MKKRIRTALDVITYMVDKTPGITATLSKIG